MLQTAAAAAVAAIHLFQETLSFKQFNGCGGGIGHVVDDEDDDDDDDDDDVDDDDDDDHNPNLTQNTRSQTQTARRGITCNTTLSQL